jgi:hypothetical protein
VNVLAIVLPSVALMVSAGITAYFQTRTHNAIKEVKDEVKTGNHKTIGGLTALAEGRRIEADVPAGDQTADQRTYVENLHAEEQ